MSVQFPVGTHPLANELNKRMLDIASRHGYRIYIVGGFLRDALIYKQVGTAKDIDYAVEKNNQDERSALSLARLAANELDGHFVLLDETNDTARVVLKTGEGLDFAGCQGGDIKADVWRRDYSINALVWNPATPDEIIDYVDGVKDIASLTIRAISEKSIVEDPLRILRAFRFASYLGGFIEQKTIEWITAHRDLLKNVASERVNYELFLTLAQIKCAREVEQMASSGVLEAIFPELKETRRVTANAFHHLALFEHSVDTVPQLEAIYPTVDAWVRESAESELAFAVSKLAATKLACLLHDIGKPQTWEIQPDGRHSFFGHDKIGADMCEVIAERMKWASSVSKLIVHLVRWHLRPGALFHHGVPTDRAIARFYRSMGDDLPELMLLAFADFGATRGPGLMGENRKHQEESLMGLLNGYPAYREAARQRVKLLNGNDVMQLLSLKPGPVIGQILEALEEAQEFKEVLDRSDAERFVKKHFAEKYSN
ncbi:MAG TPA: HDIG domain-containing metalloprotein [Planktothrix sp.]|jgi:putative nucleotidyltransferase with HDIG domain